MTGYPLAYAALAARDPAAACRFLGEGLALPCTDRSLGDRTVACFAAGRAQVMVFDVDDPYLEAPRFPGVHHMALAHPDPSAAAARHALPIAAQCEAPDGHRAVALDPAATSGIRTRLVTPYEPAPNAGPITRVDHLGIASLDDDACIDVFCRNLGCPLESRQTDLELRHVTESFVSDRYGAVYHARPPEILGGLRGAFITIGDSELEVMSDYDSSLTPAERLGEGAGNTKGDQSAIAKFLARRGPGLAHIAFATPDIDAVLGGLAEGGWRLIDRQGRPGGRGSRIGFIHPANFGGGLLIHLVEPSPEGAHPPSSSRASG